MIETSSHSHNLLELVPETYKEFQKLIYSVSGIALADSKRALLMNRIAKRMRTLNVSTPESYLEFVLAHQSEEIEKLIDVVSTNTTHFFREEPHFEFLKKLCHQWTKQKKKQVKIWCAAASSGQEPYTITMTLRENLNQNDTEFSLLGTDICSDVLLKACDGGYTDTEISNIPQELLTRYFKKLNSENGHMHYANPSIKDPITFKRLNLAEFPYPLKGGFDVIFCRNVMIYFDRPMRQKVIDQFYNLLQPGGHLILSHSENVLGISHKFKSLGSSTFLKEGV